jgi:alcohol dehydrogenase (cytochrome c)
MKRKKSVRKTRHILLGLAVSASWIAIADAQSADPQKLVKPPEAAWLTYHGEYNGRRHSKLAQITP